MRKQIRKSAAAWRTMRLSLLLLSLLLGFGIARGQAEGLTISVSEAVILPGRAVILMLNVPEDGSCDLYLESAEGERAGVIAEGRGVTAGFNSLYWNGTTEGLPVQEGTWLLVAEMNEERAEVRISVGPMIPTLISARIENEKVTEGDTVLLSFYSTEEGTVLLQEEGDLEPLCWENVAGGQNVVSFQAEMSPGFHRLKLTLVGEDGTISEPVPLELTVEEIPGPTPAPTAEPLPDYLREKAENGFTPAHVSPYRGKDQTLNYWTLPMDITDEEAVWKVLISPITVVDNGKKNAEKTQVVVRSAPSPDSEGLGMVTCVSQGVHVLERGESWTLIECYSSSFHDSPILNWNALIQGYVPTAYLKEVTPNQDWGLVVDKLTQRLYVFREGKLFSTLLISTGVANAKQPYNETRSGEFLLVSKVGEFASDNLRCAMALRFNDGDLLHEVPYILGEDGKSRDYSVNEPKLGARASHGCIRVQRQASPEGVNQRWLWNNYQKNTRILVWEDWQGRQLTAPAAETPLYALRKRTGNYHTSRQCLSLRGKRTVELTYGELETEENRKLKPCPLCAAPPRLATLQTLNTLYAAGGDHDPVLTEARKNCPRKLKGR